ncbi:MAG: tetratricopeptide repeat protein [Rhizomicrobium sp.]
MADNPDGPFFRRAVPPDREAFLGYIETQRAALAAARAGSDDAALIETAGSLGSALFMQEGSEAEAAVLLEEALALSRARGDRATEIDGLLGLGTARQYLGEREAAVALFDEGLRLCAETGIDGQENFLLHHLGRCLVELGRIGEARAAFEKALVLRRAIGNARFIRSTEQALEALARL